MHHVLIWYRLSLAICRQTPTGLEHIQLNLKSDPSLHPHRRCCVMADESHFTGWASFLAGTFVLVSLFTSWYRKRDPLVSSMISDYHCR
jgi:hypothetical protein